MALGQTTLGEKIAEARDAAKLSQQELADMIGIKNGQTVSNYERNITVPPSRRLRRIAEATSRSMSYFLDEPPEEDMLRLAIREEMADTRVLLGRIAVHLGLIDEPQVAEDKR